MANLLNSPRELSVGEIPYFNLIPFYNELKKQRYGNIVLKKGPPTSVNRMLHQGEITLAPCSSICLVSQIDHEVALPLGVASDGAVQSVYLGLHAEHVKLLEYICERRKVLKDLFTEARTLFGDDSRKISSYIERKAKTFKRLPVASISSIKFSSESATSVALAKIFLRLWFGEEVYKLMVNPSIGAVRHNQRPLELLIGDEALYRKRNFYKTLDLGSLWKEMTGFPFVYAIWQSKGSCLNGWRRKILEIGEVADNRMKIEPSVYLPDREPKDSTGRKINLAEYWRHIYYRLGPREFKGLLIYLCLSRCLNVVNTDQAVIAKIARWQQVSNNTGSHWI